MIITVTLNPAVDKTIYLEILNKGKVNKVEYSSKDPGGKGINVSRVVNNLGCNTIAAGFIGGENGEYIKKILTEMGIKHSFTEITEDIRTNIKIVENSTGDTTDINEQGPDIDIKQRGNFLNTYRELIVPGVIIVLAGSIPGGIDNNVYKALTEIGKNAGARVIIDASGAVLKEGIKAGPYMIKPNISELEDITDTVLDTEEKIISACREINKSGVEIVCVSMGSEGALLVTENYILKAEIPEVVVRSTVGAGDSLVAGIVAGMDSGFSLDRSFKTGIAASIVAVTREGTKAATSKEVDDIIDRVEVIRGEIEKYE